VQFTPALNEDKTSPDYFMFIAGWVLPGLKTGVVV
jgi:hypothetical protein